MVNKALASPIISVIVPIYNVVDFLPRCLDSIVAQTIFSQLEVNLVDDASTDGAADICQDYVDRYIFRYVLQERQGVSLARNIGLSLATGDYISFIDSDDAISADFYEFLLKLSLEKQVDLGSTSIDLKHKFGKTFKKQTNYYSADSKFILIDFILGRGISYNSVDKLYKESFIEQVRFDPNCSCDKDFLFNFEVLLNISSVYQDRSQARYFYYYREGSATDINQENHKEKILLFYAVGKAFALSADIDVKNALQQYVLSQYLSFFATAYSQAQSEMCSKLKTLVSGYNKNLYNNPFIGRFLILELFIADKAPFLLRYYRGIARRMKSMTRK